jgi:hypothetical protein
LLVSENSSVSPPVCEALPLKDTLVQKSNLITSNEDGSEVPLVIPTLEEREEKEKEDIANLNVKRKRVRKDSKKVKSATDFVNVVEGERLPVSLSIIEEKIMDKVVEIEEVKYAHEQTDELLNHDPPLVHQPITEKIHQPIPSQSFHLAFEDPLDAILQSNTFGNNGARDDARVVPQSTSSRKRPVSVLCDIGTNAPFVNEAARVIESECPSVEDDTIVVDGVPLERLKEVLYFKGESVAAKVFNLAVASLTTSSVSPQVTEQSLQLLRDLLQALVSKMCVYLYALYHIYIYI